MPVRHPARRHKRPLPMLWLMTDERMGDRLWPAIAALPRGSGIVFRHLMTEAGPRTALRKRVAIVARRCGIVLVDETARRTPIAIARVHSVREGIAARHAGAELVFVSPVHPTRTHPGTRTLGPVRAAIIARTAQLPAIALGGMNERKFRRMKALGFAGWAAIDGLTPDQKRNAVPI